MKKLVIFTLCSSVILASSTLAFERPEKVDQAGEYLTIGRITNPLLLNLLKKSEQKKYRILSKEKPQICKALVIDGEQITETKIIKSEEIKEAIDHSRPIIISEPAKSKIKAMTGFGIEGSKAMVIIPKKKGEEFEIQLVGSNKKQPSQALEEEEKSISAIIHKVESSKGDQKNDDGNETPGISHRRWTVLEAKPQVWDKKNQGSYIHVGFQYDLFYVCVPKPARKYLYVKSIGTGVSSGKLKHDHRFHRGYYQDKVMIDIEGKPSDGWTGPNLQLEDYTPQSDNSLNQEQDTLGFSVWANGILGIGFGSNSSTDNTGATAGVGIFTQHSITKEFNDFSANFEPTTSSDQWVFWMSGAQGAKIRKKHPSKDIVSRTLGIFCTVKELPQMASDSVLNPDIQALYYTHGDQQGSWTMTTTVGQYLTDVKIYGLFRKTKRKSHQIPQTITIDFNQVNKCKDKGTDQSN